MIHARKDYNRFQDPALEDPSLVSEGSTPIAEDEPVMLFRAKDKFFKQILIYYLTLIGSDLNYPQEEKQRIFNAVSKHLTLTDEWYKENKSQYPTIPEV